MVRNIRYRGSFFFISLLVILTCLRPDINAQDSTKISVRYNTSATQQTIRNFSASDAWACQFVGNWPDEKKNVIADWLFSLDTLADGSPQGIGLSMWRYNIGAGSAEQGDSSGIKDEWRRAASFNSNITQAKNRIRSQNWFLIAAKKRGVKQFLGFFNSPPVDLTLNGKAYASNGKCNISSNIYKTFAQYAVAATKKIKQLTGITFDYISPVNEPQWDWSDGNQEGSPYKNTEISGIAKSFNTEFLKHNMSSKILITESGHLRYLLKSDDKPDRDDQITHFFSPSSPDYVGDLPRIARVIAAHSYFTTSPGSYALTLRNQVKDRIAQTGNIEYWQSEYCILGDNAGEIDGNKRDTGMKAALYVAKVIYYDLTGANASAWQWWLALSPYNYKDGLIYIDKNKTNGNFYDSKMLWALGNYSRFIRPGMQRITVDGSSQDLYVSGYKDPHKDAVVLVLVNASATQQPISLASLEFRKNKRITTYTTDNAANLKKGVIMADQLIIPAESIVTVVIEGNKELSTANKTAVLKK